MTPAAARRLGKAVALLSSAADGEALAAARAIGRIVEAEGLGWHGFARMIEAEAARQSMPAFSFAKAAPRTARKAMAHLARQPGLSDVDRRRIEAFRAQLLGARRMTLAGDDIAWLDSLWHRAHGTGDAG